MENSIPLPNPPLVIVASDHRMTRHMILSILEKDGVKVLEAANGREALELFSGNRPDLIISDIMMPVMDGLEFCRRLQELPEETKVPVLVFTTHSEGGEVDEAFRAGAADFINKPLNPEELRHRARRLLYLRALERNRMSAEGKLKDSNKKIRSLSRKVLSAYEEERARLARELHDELGMTLTTLKLNLQLLNKDLSGKKGTKGRLNSVLDLVNNALAATRSRAHLMRPPSLDDLGLVTVVENMLADLGRNSDMQTRMQTRGEYRGLPVEVEIALYRCVQEAITNVARHSWAKNVTVDMGFNESQVFVSIKDDGIGFADEDAASSRHLGLQGMMERVDILSGDINIKSAKGEGTEITISIPLEGYQGG